MGPEERENWVQHTAGTGFGKRAEGGVEGKIDKRARAGLPVLPTLSIIFISNNLCATLYAVFRRAITHPALLIIVIVIVIVSSGIIINFTSGAAAQLIAADIDDTAAAAAPCYVFPLSRPCTLPSCSVSACEPIKSFGQEARELSRQEQADQCCQSSSYHVKFGEG